jgi:hypothetical protein
MMRILPYALLVPLAALSILRASEGPKDEPAKPSPARGRLFEMRTYYTLPGRLDALNARFREHTNKLFVKHGMELVGYWTPQGKDNTLVYILAYPNRVAREASWKAFQADPEWKAAREASEKDGKIVDKVESVFLDPTDYSPIK